MRNESGEVPRSLLRPWLTVVEGALEGIELAAWEVRGLAERAREAWDQIEDDWDDVARDVRLVARELESWPRRFARLGDTAWLLVQVAASYRVQRVRDAFLTRDGTETAWRELHDRNAQRFASASERHGGAFLKVAQLLSARPDLLPEVWVAELSRLQDAAAPVSAAAARRVVEEEFGQPLEVLFDQFDSEPLAAASIGQVHRARTTDGREVAVKVQRPGIGALVELDLDLLEVFVESLGNLLPPADYDTIVRQVRERVSGELDYVAEVRVMERVADFFAGHPAILVPRTLPELCGERVITSEFVQGSKITRALDEQAARRDAGDAAAGERLSRVLGLVLEAYSRQILEAGVFQADPHPGNLLVTPDDRLVLLDFGCAQELPAETRRRYAALLGAYLRHDRGAVAARLAELGFATQSGRPDTLERFADAMLGALRDAVARGQGVPWLDRDALWQQASEWLEQIEEDPVIRIPDEFVMLGRVFAALGGLFHHYRPHLDLDPGTFLA